MLHLSKEQLILELEQKNIQLHDLQQKLEQIELKNEISSPTVNLAGEIGKLEPVKLCDKLNKDQIARYSRQLILPELGCRGQKTLVSSSVLIVGCGGLGCPAAIYLAGAGVGRLGLVDYDIVETSNLHRQVLHTEASIGEPKVHSLARSITGLNSFVEVITYYIQINSSSAMGIVQNYDVVLDCTDNVATRYLLNDACVFASKPLVSGSALRFEGQLTVYRWGVDGPCYRCIFPQPPPPDTVTNCGDGGVLGSVPGVIGCLQATEAIKIITNAGSVLSQRLLLYDGLESIFRTVKLRARQPSCAVCGINPVVIELLDYEQFCGAQATDKDKQLKLLPSESRISVEEYKQLKDSKFPHILIDVRLPTEIEMCSLPDTVNIPLKCFKSETDFETVLEKLKTHENWEKSDDLKSCRPLIVCVCRRGNDSQLAVSALGEKLSNLKYDIKDIIGGLADWAEKIDISFPVY